MKKTVRLVSAIVLASGATAAMADVLVVRATGPSAKKFQAGKSLPDNAKVTLVANDALVVLDGRGTRTLRGPGTFSPGGPIAATATTAVAANSSQRRARIGAVRSVGSGGGGPRTPSIWHVDVSKSSTMCLADPANVTLWRADASKPVTLTVSGAGGAKRDLAWGAGQTTLMWPGELPIADGSDYRLSWTGGAAPTNVRFRALGTRPTGLEDTASALIQNGCSAQLDLLIETVKLPEDPATPAG